MKVYVKHRYVLQVLKTFGCFLNYLTWTDRISECSRRLLSGIWMTQPSCKLLNGYIMQILTNLQEGCHRVFLITVWQIYELVLAILYKFKINELFHQRIVNTLLHLSTVFWTPAESAAREYSFAPRTFEGGLPSIVGTFCNISEDKKRKLTKKPSIKHTWPFQNLLYSICSGSRTVRMCRCFLCLP